MLSSSSSSNHRQNLLSGIPSPVPEESVSAAIRRGVSGRSVDSAFSASSSRSTKKRSTTIALTVALVALVFARSVDQVLFYRLNYMYKFYVFVLSAIILPLAFILVSIPVVLYKWFYTKDITMEMKQFSQKNFAVMGALDCLFNILSTLPVQHIGGSLANVLSQTVLPINMLLAFIFLSTRYKNCHYLGACLVIYGVLVKMMPGIFPKGVCDSSPDASTLKEEGGEVGGGELVGWVLLLVFSQLFSAGSNVYKEIALKGTDMDEWYMNLYVALWQVAFGVLCFWQGYVGAFTDPLPAIGSCEDCTWSNMLQGSFECFAGNDDVTVYGLTSKQCTTNDGRPGPNDTCQISCSTDVDGTPYGVFAVFLIFNIAFNLLMLYVFKHGSSVLFVVANAVRLPLVQILLLSQEIAGSATQKFTTFDLYALPCLALAIIVYYSEKEDKAPGDDVLDGEEVPIGSLGRHHASFSRLSFCDVPGTTKEESEDNVGINGMMFGRLSSSQSGGERHRYSFSSFPGSRRRRNRRASFGNRFGNRSNSGGTAVY
eukprot:g511.t1